MSTKNDKKKGEFVGALAKYGTISAACDKLGIGYWVYRRWYESDEEFARSVDECADRRIDHVESKLMERIDAGDVTSIIFFLKTQGRKRGWSERVAQQAQLPAAAPAAVKDAAPVEKKMQARLTSRKTYLVKLLKEQGKYTPELSLQVHITAQTLLRTEILAEEIFSADHRPANVEISREGNERESISPKEKLYLSFLQQSQKALRALGMNIDAKERRTESDGLGEFLEQFKPVDE